MKHNSDVPGQLTLLTVAPTIETRTTIHDPYWDEIIAPQQLEDIPGMPDIGKEILVGAQVTSITVKPRVGGKVTLDTEKSAPQHDTHWIEKYWVERSGNKYWYYRYCWMVGRKKNRLYLGSVDSIIAKRKKADIEVWIWDGKLPFEIKDLIQGWKYEPSTMPKMPPGNTNF
ncbi:Arm DNA-binding domain-containing protein [Nostoc sphaeroides CHAB 2801]|uniref:Arm DNA-binding domain-containing protein n=1 Tax=Nostoc sphaeroides TaxID=446679 RepID=UPI000E484165|nr:Arm DNA-binding domain-containing protein [Nostoc sphaeroides]MCC5629079.1 Arm DNA-binding domain-containing protein [Nostoc sphaeroides CHAB 2801]